MTTLHIDAVRLTDLVQGLLQFQGVSAHDAKVTADSLVCADLEGVASHGVMLLPMYLARLRAGSVRANAQTQVEEDLGGLVIMSAQDGLGQVSSQAAVSLAIERARIHGLSTVTVRDGFHFGAASYWARQFAQAGMIGMAFSNTRPLMPAPGGAQRVVGNNPVAMAFPSAQGQPLVVDMAMSATAMGKIRLADAQGRPIPEGWATSTGTSGVKVDHRYARRGRRPTACLRQRRCVAHDVLVCRRAVARWDASLRRGSDAPLALDVAPPPTTVPEGSND